MLIVSGNKTGILSAEKGGEEACMRGGFTEKETI